MTQDTRRPREWAGNCCYRCGGKRTWRADGDVDVSKCVDCGTVERFHPTIDLMDYMQDRPAGTERYGVPARMVETLIEVAMFLEPEAWGPCGTEVMRGAALRRALTARIQ